MNVYQFDYIQINRNIYQYENRPKCCRFVIFEIIKLLRQNLLKNLIPSNSDLIKLEFSQTDANYFFLIRPALRSSNIPTSLNHEDPKVSKHIRFNLSRDDQIGKNNSAISENMTPTPPPKEFKRNSQRKTLRNVRCMSTIVTEKEKSLLESAIAQSSGHMDSPRAPQGFVKSMCKFYADNFSPSRLGSKLNRSNSFTSGKLMTLQKFFSILEHFFLTGGHF